MRTSRQSWRVAQLPDPGNVPAGDEDDRGDDAFTVLVVRLDGCQESIHVIRAARKVVLDVPAQAGTYAHRPIVPGSDAYRQPGAIRSPAM